MSHTPDASQKTLIVNLFGAPNTGKSRLAMRLTAALKVSGSPIRVEYVTEYAKELSYAEHNVALRDQLHVGATQNHKLAIVDQKVEAIITDSPSLLSVIYMDPNCPYHAEYKALMLAIFRSQRNLNFYLDTDFAHEAHGRVHDVAQCAEKRLQIQALLDTENIPYTRVRNPSTALPEILTALFREQGVLLSPQELSELLLF